MTSDAEERRLFVTGASGLVGSHAAARFRESGWRVRALVRPGSRTRFIEGLGAEMVLGDVTDPESFSGAAEGCDAVLHAAAHLGASAPWEHFRSVNVDGTRHVLAEAIRSGCRRFVHVSSVAVYGPPADQPRLPLDEDAPTDVPLGPSAHYERSKRMAEAAVRRTAEGAVEWSIVRPAVVMGERDRHFTPRVARLADRRLLVTVGAGDNRLPVVYAGNVAEACRLAAVRDEARSRAFNVADDGGITQRQLFEEAAPRRATFLPLPRSAVEAAAGAADALADLWPGEVGGALSARRVWFLAHDNPFRSRRIRAQLGWEPRVDTREGWRRALAWWRESGARGG